MMLIRNVDKTQDLKFYQVKNILCSLIGRAPSSPLASVGVISVGENVTGSVTGSESQRIDEL